jgi:hypothetical protein
MESFYEHYDMFSHSGLLFLCKGLHLHIYHLSTATDFDEMWYTECVLCEYYHTCDSFTYYIIRS